MVERVVAVIGPGLEIDAYMIGMFNVWALPITMDPKWNGGDYYGQDEPLEGVAQALKIVTLIRERQRRASTSASARKWAVEATGPAPGKGVRDRGPVLQRPGSRGRRLSTPTTTSIR